MNEVAAIVEGETEQVFVRDLLAPHLLNRGISIWATLPGKPGQRSGGARSWKLIRKEICRTLKGRPGLYCTTMFDFYALPNDWPGRDEASRLPVALRGQRVEDKLKEDMVQHVGPDFHRDRFIPYVQVHEFEALVFSDIDTLAKTTTPLSRHPEARLQSHFSQVLKNAGTPESIDDGYETCPSRRIMSMAPSYRKAAHGPIIAKRIGLDRLRQACPHFNQWVCKLESGWV